ncbi:phosphatase [Cytophagales bacterium LB-30]|uniref:Phosphatase n=1 Tax=Shiella aurantiaca TaxID=3058365 RepID=A0ABT8F416_9BACT|nr:phosphatase [Shiella aurantiaca]
MKLAAIDIGSNAIRFQLTHVVHFQDKTNFKKVEYIRFPLRLGHDVFHLKKISPEKEAKFIKLMHTYKLLIELYEVDEYMACATSAMRESVNGHDIAQKVHELCGLKIQIIDGSKEAEITNRAIYKFLDEKPYLHIDVGGGSTELNLYINRVKTATKSFKIGSVRRMEQLDSPQVWGRMQAWLEENLPAKSRPIAVGTGGNINKLFDLAGGKKGKTVTLNKILQVADFIKGHNMEERINLLQLNPDRADVIIPASEIYTSVMRWGKCSKILVPDVGLKDGMMEIMYERQLKKKWGKVD